ncbi:TonB-dependent receptor [Algiphilus sp.]|uniref:TonB-dependent receptor n=1 Tax=Algiphilus sp. TaxID=1872431 RepID=UPI003B525612
MTFHNRCPRTGLFAAVCMTATAWTPAMAQEAPADEATFDPVVVSATRTESTVSQTARSVTIIDAETIQRQASLDRNLSTILASEVPGLGPSTQAATNFGQTLRGRNFLVLIDGIPQSTPLRDASRDLNTISPASIERVEVVRGGTAAYGFGATGGLINIITKKSEDAPTAGYSAVGVRYSTEEFDDSGIFETEHGVSGTRGAWDYLFSGSLVERQGLFDAEGRRIPPDPLGSQGGFADSTEYSLLGKVGYAIDDLQRVQFMVNHLDNEQESDFTFDTELRDGRTPAIPLSEAPDDARFVRSPGTRNTVANISYSHANLAGSTLRLNSYYGDQEIVFGKFPGFSQGGIASEKFGSRTTIDTPLTLLPGALHLIWGADYLRDETDPVSFQAPDAVPAMEQDAFAGFAEVEIPLGDAGLIRGGLRHEVISVDTATVDSNRSGNRVEAGTLDYDETLFNLGGVLYLSPQFDLFASFSQGFSLADIGRVLADAGPFEERVTFQAEDFESEAQKTDNYELGLRWSDGRLSTSLAVFYSRSDNGTTFDDDAQIRKFAEDIHGAELTFDYTVSDMTTFGGTVSRAKGERESADGTEVKLDGTRIAPLKVTAYFSHSPLPGWDNRLQLTHIGDRDEFPNADGPESFAGFGEGEIDGYTLVDLVSSFAVGPGTLQLSVSNLLNKDYVPMINQAFNIPSAFSSGPGRMVGLNYRLDW